MNPGATHAVPCRPVTDDEVQHLHDRGWVLLKQYIDVDVLGRMLTIAREKMGDDADSNAMSRYVEAAVAEGGAGVQYFNAQPTNGLHDPTIRPVIDGIGREAKSLLRRRNPHGDALDIRYYQDFFAPKLPSSRTSRHGGNGPTAFHQDFITFAVDRTGGMTFWVPLESYGPDAGTMSFVNGSHRLGVLGDYTTYEGGDALSAFPELQDLEMSEPVTYELGDVTVHSHLTVHGAGANTLERPRWAWLLLTQPADVCWNGAPCPNFDHSAMRPWQRMDGDRFPVIS